jgi:hypothetical protein
LHATLAANCKLQTARKEYSIERLPINAEERERGPIGKSIHKLGPILCQIMILRLPSKIFLKSEKERLPNL